MKIRAMKINHLALACAIAALTTSFHAAAHQRYRVVVLPPEGGAGSFTAGYTDLGTLSGYDCSAPYRINNRDQIVGYAFSCETGAVSAFIWEDGEMVDLNALIPADSGVQVQFPTWIDEDGVISAQGVLTAGASSGDTRALLLIPAGACDPSDLSAAVKALSAKSPSADAAGGTAKPASLRDRNGRPDSRWLRPLSPAQLRDMMQHSSD
jgi:probable HAF family extracellular repeat protein